MNLKYNALKIDEIEKANKKPLEQCIADYSIGNIALLVQKGMETANEKVTREQAFETIDEYLKDHDKEDLILDIIEAMINAGFLAREINIQEVRANKSQLIKEAMGTMK